MDSNIATAKINGQDVYWDSVSETWRSDASVTGTEINVRFRVQQTKPVTGSVLYFGTNFETVEMAVEAMRFASEMGWLNENYDSPVIVKTTKVIVTTTTEEVVPV